VWNTATDEIRQSRRWGTREAIEQIAHGRVLAEIAREVDEAVVRSDIWGFTERDFPSQSAEEGDLLTRQ